MVDYIGAEVAALTYGHPLGYIPAAALTHIITLIVHQGCAVDEAIAAMQTAIKEQLYDEKAINCFLNIIRKAVDLAYDKSVEDREAIRMLGEGWVAEEALAIALFCSLRYSNDFSSIESRWRQRFNRSHNREHHWSLRWIFRNF